MQNPPSPSEAVESALREGGSTAELFLALVAADVRGDWSRIELLTRASGRVARSTAADAEPGGTRWNGHRLTGTAARAVRVAQGIARDYDLDPLPPGALVLGLIASPETAVSAALRLGRERERDAFAALVQEELLGTELEGLDLTARWKDTEGAVPPADRTRPAPPVPDRAPARPKEPPRLSTRPPTRPKAPPRPPARSRRTASRRILLFGTVLLVIAGVVGMSTAPEPDRPGPPAHRILLADDAVGAGFTALPGQTRASSPAPGPGTGRLRCENAARRWVRGQTRVLIEIRRCESFVRAANLHHLAERGLLAGAASRTPTTAIPHGLLTRGVEPTETRAPYAAVMFRRGQYITHVRMAAPGRALPSGGERLLVELAQRQWRATPGTPGDPVRPVSGRDLSARVSLYMFLLTLGLVLVANISAAARNRRLAAVSRWPLDTPGLTWHDVSEPAWRMGYEAQARFWFFCGLWGALLVLPLPPIVKIIGFGLCANQFTLSGHFQPGRHRLWGRHSAPQIRLRIRAGGAGIRALAAAARGVQLAALVPLAMIVILVLLGPYGYLQPLGRFDPVVVADSTLSRPVRLLPVPLVVLGLALITATSWKLAALLYRTALRHNGLDADRLRRLDPRPPVLYLRNGADDALTIRTSPPTRWSVFDKFRANQFEPFEEVIVRFLSAYGPVIALEHPNSPPAPPGSIRAAVPDEQWEPMLLRHVRESGLIVIGAAPETFGAGLGWEMTAITEMNALDRTILVLAPRPADEITRYWRRFREMSPFAIPHEIDPHADRTLAVHGAPSGRWTAVHGDKRTDWAYGLAVSHLAEQMIGPGQDRSDPR
ncbi:hypothetical protein [Thermomonospora cellulosilytica]|uniref:Uncharacterized protein n=1 Tax=Thermomonospora cellulosilytica TaxID=1411118 RepID=A0A7W3N0L9_9ACTN|nr:hypothetical protein [Thermomonospora cellulosilytica]MBA9005330.1 hypothetical protein [Thermomonospora cellulosilytica]